MRRVSSCLLAACFFAALGSAAEAAGPGFHDRAGPKRAGLSASFGASRPHAGFAGRHRVGPEFHGRRGFAHRAFRRSPYGLAGFPYRSGWPLDWDGPGYAGEPAVFQSHQPKEQIITYGVPTVAGIREAPAGQPTLYVLHAASVRTGGRNPGPRVLSARAGEDAADETGPRIVHLAVPQARPRGRAYKRWVIE